jgi:glycosyltransferase involved in cell wall biosynthesis
MPTLAICLPTRNRPHRLEALMANLLQTTPEPFTFYAAVTDEESQEILQRVMPSSLVMLTPARWTAIQRAQFLYDHTRGEDYVFLAADDYLFHPGWLPPALAMMAQVDGVVTINDLFDGEQVGAGPMFSRNYISTCSGVFDEPNVLQHRGYHHGYADIETIQTAIERGRFAWCRDGIVEHLRYNSGKPGACEYDETYRDLEEHYSTDLELFQIRMHARDRANHA